MSRACYVNSLSVGKIQSISHYRSQCYYVGMYCRLLYRLCISVSRRGKKWGKGMIDKRRKYVCNIILLIVSTENEE